MSLPSPAELLRHAEEMARAAGEVTLRYYGEGLAREAKEDGSPVTVADRAAEELIRGLIQERFPRHGILGEEFGETKGEDPVRWILDPIDGTRSFMRGVPLYAVLIGVEVEGEPVVGVVYFPALDEMVGAARGKGCFWNGEPARVSRETRMEAALVLTTDEVEIRSSPVSAGWKKLARTADYVRGWGDAYGHALVATGRAEIMVDPILSPWDSAPLLTVVTEAGGIFTDLDGNPSIHGGSGVSSNGHLHADALRILCGTDRRPLKK